MVQIDRMEIDDAGSDPKKLAKAILEQLPDGTVKIPVREIAKAIDIYEIREARLSGLEGALIVPRDKSEGAILINGDRHENRKRYTIAHEIGHYVHPFHRANSPDGFRCRAKDLAVEKAKPNDQHSRMEQQANEFAAELLMPARSVAEFIRASGDADLANILELAQRHEVSREAAARRYIPRIGDPAAVVFSKAGVVRYARCNEFFPGLSVARGQPVPQNSVSALSNADIGEVTDSIEVDGLAWLNDAAGVCLFEQTLAQKNGFRMTLLTAELDDTDEEWDAPAFYGRR
ncbi:MAG: ImmA/IrrE family metallo-endopeptidase [Pseudomonadota bacterium]